MQPVVPAVAIHFTAALVLSVLLIFVVGPLCLIALIQMDSIGRTVISWLSPVHTLVQCSNCGHRNLAVLGEVKVYCSQCQNQIHSPR